MQTKTMMRSHCTLIRMTEYKELTTARADEDTAGPVLSDTTGGECKQDCCSERVWQSLQLNRNSACNPEIPHLGI